MAEAPHAELRRRHRQRKERDEPRPLLLRDIDDADEAERLVAALGDRLRVHDHQRLPLQRHRAMHGDERLERRGEERTPPHTPALRLPNIPENATPPPSWQGSPSSPTR